MTCLRHAGSPAHESDRLSSSAATVRIGALRIAVLAPPWFPVPPQRYGGTEAVVSLLVDGLVREGHDVTLFASGDSQTPARLVSCFDERAARRLGTTAARTPARAHLRARGRALRHRQRPHRRARAGALEPHVDAVPEHRARHARRRGGRALPARLRRYPGRGARLADREPPRAPRRDLPWAATIPNAIALDDHPCRDARAAASTCSGSGACRRTRARSRRSRSRAPRACRCCSPASCGAPRSSATSPQEVQPRLGGGIAYVGEIDLHERVRLLHGAHALINPLAWDEPFGLVMVEAMACGVPVIAHAAGLGARDRRPRRDRLDRRDGGGDGRRGRALRRDRPGRVPRDRRALLLAGAHGGRLRGRLPRRHRARPNTRSPLAQRTTPAVERWGFGRGGVGTTARPLPPGERRFPCSLCSSSCLLLAIVFGGFFVFSLKVAVVVAIVLLLAGAFGGYSFRGRRTA